MVLQQKYLVFIGGEKPVLTSVYATGDFMQVRLISDLEAIKPVFPFA